MRDGRFIVILLVVFLGDDALDVGDRALARLEVPAYELDEPATGSVRPEIRVVANELN